MTLPSPLDAAKVAVCAKDKYNVIVAPGAMFEVVGDDDAMDLKRNIRLCFAWEGESSLEEGIKRLGKAVCEMQNELDRHGTDDPSPRVVWSESSFR